MKVSTGFGLVMVLAAASAPPPGASSCSGCHGAASPIAGRDAKVTPEDLERYGMIPELVGRLPIITTLNQLSEEDLARILNEPKDALTKQYEVLFH